MIRLGGESPRRKRVGRSRSDEVLPEDFFRMLRGQIGRRGEVKLALAVLEDAVRCLDGNEDPWRFPPRLFRWEAEQWIESRDRAPLFGFENVCSVLSLDAEDLRERIRRWRARSPGERTDSSRRVARSLSMNSFTFRIDHPYQGGIIESPL